MRALVLCPTTELAVQVGAVARQTMPLRVAVATGGPERPLKTQKCMLLEGVDVLVATVGRAAALIDTGALDLSCCRAVVLDEVDVLVLDASFPLATIGSAVARNEASGLRSGDGGDGGDMPHTQFVFVTATLPRGVVAQLKNEFTGLKEITGPGLHKVSEPCARFGMAAWAAHYSREKTNQLDSHLNRAWYCSGRSHLC